MCDPNSVLLTDQLQHSQQQCRLLKCSCLYHFNVSQHLYKLITLKMRGKFIFHAYSFLGPLLNMLTSLPIMLIINEGYLLVTRVLPEDSVNTHLWVMCRLVVPNDRTFSKQCPQSTRVPTISASSNVLRVIYMRWWCAPFHLFLSTTNPENQGKTLRKRGRLFTCTRVVV